MLIDVVRPKALLQLDGIEQSVSFLYSYAGVKTASTNSSAHDLQEKYHFGSAFTIIDPDIVQFTLGVDLGLDQNFGTQGGSGNGFTWDYLFTGSALQYDPYPISVTSARTTTQIATAYMPTYTATTNANQLWARLLNKTVPLSLHYNRTSLDTSGLDRNSSSTNDVVTLEGSHNYRDRSVSDLLLSYDGSHADVAGTPQDNTRSYNVTGTNTFSIDKQSKYTLATSFSVGEAKQGTIPSSNANFTENFNAILGKTLQGRATYQHNYNKTLAADQKSEQLQETDSITGQLSHQLFQSLTTTVNGMWQNQNLTAGDEQDYGGGIALNYQKRLPAKGLLRLGASQSRNYVDRNSGVTQLTVRDEPHHVTQQGQIITLTAAGNLSEVKSVASHKPDPNNPPTVYVEGVDYSVNLALGQIEILPGGQINPPADIFVSYTLVQNPTVQYYTDSTALTSSISLLENRYVLSGDYTKQNQHLISGNTQNLSLFDATAYHLRFDVNLLENFLTTEYANVDSGQTKYWYTLGSYRWVKRLAYSDVGLNMQDRYTFYDATETSKSTSQNEFSLGGSYSRGVFTWGRLTLSGNYANTTGDIGAGNYAYLRGNLQGRLNQLLFSLTGQTSVRITKGQTNRNDSVLLSVTRTF